MKTPIHDFLERYAKSGAVRLHMPGGKGLEYPSDITEISGADELYDCGGIIRESEHNAASLFGTADTCYSCGGATLAIQAMISAACELTGKHKIAAGRYSHRSFVDTAILLGLDVEWIYPDEFLGCTLSPEAVEAAIDSDTAAVFVNSVDYLGGEADIAAISAVCKRHGVLLLCDNAHGAYKVFTGDHPLRSGADMTADSAHKTLPTLTGTAYLHLADSAFYAPAKAAMSLFGSSSPSYLMLDSLDLCNAYIAKKRDDALWTIKLVRELKEALAAGGVTLRKSDDMRITIDANTLGYSGHELAAIMREKGAECEMSGLRYVVLLFSVVQPESDFAKTAEILHEIQRKAPVKPASFPVLMPERRLSLREAYFAEKATVPVSDAAGRICAGVCSPCPPCVPPVMPGELVGEAEAGLLAQFGVKEIPTVARA